jgi:DNA segregation ATPase FtsK/SpoIIIE, S-DNA-T family
LNEKSSDISFSMPHLAHQNGEAVIKKSVDSDGDVDDEELSFTVESQNNDDDKEYNGPVLSPYNPKLDLENYKYPTIDLLKSYDDQGPNIDMEEQNANKDRIINVLRSFGIEISSIKASVGPTITLYEITPAEGVRISKIRNLEDDIALSLSALGIRIIAPIPGKGTIGIEVPNANPKIVSMRSIINSKKFQETTYDLPVALGKTITNDVFMVDLTKAPHMRVAGATGQGKSVGLNAIVTSLLYKKHPAELKFVIIDPKKVEFSVYAPIERHFLAKLPDGDDAIITDVTKVVQTLNSLCSEMDTRYDLLRKAGCRNIKEYNAKFISRKLNPEKGHRFMPYIVIIIDEFGDLIMTAGKEIELPICRIAQLARAIGIHAIIATQRPTTNIITGTIKANFPARIAFRVAAMMDSRTILDRSGAQQLIGKGDMLYLQGNDPVRVQCAFVDTPEVENITNYISKQQGYTSAFMLPEYVGEESESTLGDIDMNRLDPMFEDAARLIVIHQQGSTSLIQRKFSIGYNRAGRIMDQLERAGIVGPTQGSKAREVLCVDETDLQMRLSNLQQ